MSGAETTVIDEWLLDVLAGVTDSTGVYEDLAPVDAQYPFIVFQHQASSDVVGVGPNARIMVDADYIVRVVAAVSSFADIADIAAEMDGLLDGQTGAASGGVVLGVARREQYREVEQYESQQIRHLGGRYRIVAQGA